MNTKQYALALYDEARIAMCSTTTRPEFYYMRYEDQRLLRMTLMAYCNVRLLHTEARQAGISMLIDPLRGY